MPAPECAFLRFRYNTLVTKKPFMTVIAKKFEEAYHSVDSLNSSVHPLPVLEYGAAALYRVLPQTILLLAGMLLGAALTVSIGTF
jgi:hypothetical protein